MNLNEQLMIYKKTTQAEPQEEKIQAAIGKSKEAFLASEQERTLSYHEFLWVQLKVIQKRWWLLQLLLLLLLWATLMSGYEETYIQRSMGVTASLFVILIIPELWKNRSCRCMEVEAASFYSLRQIYAARMLLFGIADILLITVFCGTASVGLHFELTALMIQFLFPMSVTACICFGILCSKYSFGETAAIGLCIVWSTIWLFIILNESIYAVITFPLWFALLGIALTCLTIAIWGALRGCNKYWEGPVDGIEI